MSNGQDRVRAITRRDIAASALPLHDITVYNASGASSEYTVMWPSSGGVTAGTSDSGQLVGWYDPGYPPRPRPPEAWLEVAEIASARREMVNRLAAINATLKRIQGHLATVERAHNAPAALVRAPHLDALAWMKAATGLPDSRVAALLGVTRQALVRWRKGDPMAASKRRHLFAVRDVLERAAQQYPSVEALGAWLDTPQRPDGRTPSDLLAEGEIDQARLLAVTRPSDSVVAPPAWVSQAATIQSPREHRWHQALPPWYEDAIDEHNDEADADVFVPLDLDEA